MSVTLCLTPSPQGRIFLAPFFHVTFSDFWIADQMNSLAVLLLDLEYFWCYMIYGIHFPGTSRQDTQSYMYMYGSFVGNFLLTQFSWYM